MDDARHLVHTVILLADNQPRLHPESEHPWARDNEGD